ncbi:MAG: TetR family transcriptional regulator [Azospirillum sp.]|nr:TetR family transcriptional regulator [Azospirillum sp.]
MPLSPAPHRRWSRRKQARPSEILAAALDVFAERGFAAARLDDVAARAGISKGTLYLYFPDKAALFKALVREAILPNLDQAEAALASHTGSAEALLRALVRRFLAVLLDQRLIAVPKLVIGESGNFPELAEFYLNEVIRRGKSLFAQVIERGIAAGEFRAVPAAVAAPLVIAPVLFTAIWKSTFEPHDPGNRFDAEAFLDLHLDLLLHGLSRSPDGSPEPQA